MVAAAAFPPVGPKALATGKPARNLAKPKRLNPNRYADRSLRLFPSHQHRLRLVRVGLDAEYSLPAQACDVGYRTRR